MKKPRVILFVTLMVFGVVGIANATIMHYSVSGTMGIADTNWNNYHTEEIYGDMYLSDSFDVISPFDHVHVNISSFAIFAGDYGWGGAGMIDLMPEWETRYNLNGVGNSGSVSWFTGDFFDANFPGDFSQMFAHYPDVLPDVINFPDFPWYHGEEILSQPRDLVVTYAPAIDPPSGLVIELASAPVIEPASAPVPEPASILLLATGLVGLSRFGQKKFRKI